MPPDGKGSRAARACNVCRIRKVRCDGALPSCGPCASSGADCTFEIKAARRAPQATRVHVERLETRLNRLERMLGIQGDGPTMDSRADKGNSSNPTPSDSTRTVPGSPESTVAATHLVAAADEHSAWVVQRGKETSSSEEAYKLPTVSRFIGTSSALSILSAEGIQWVRSQAGDSSPHTLNKLQSYEVHGLDKLLPASGLSSTNTYTALPAREECVMLLSHYWRSSNRTYPLFDEQHFMARLDAVYTDASPCCPGLGSGPSSGWWASVHIALAIGSVVREPTERSDSYRSSSFFATAMASLSDVSTQVSDLDTIQALLGAVVFLTGTPRTHDSLPLLALAIQHIHRLGLHRASATADRAHVDAEQRRRVFWIAYIIDKELSIRLGQPPLQDDDDFDVELPAAVPPDGLGMMYAHSQDPEQPVVRLNYFRAMAAYMTIQGQSRRRLYSVRAGYQSRNQTLQAIAELHGALESWRQAIPAAFRPGNDMAGVEESYRFYITVLHLAYYSAVELIHRRNGHSSWTNTAPCQLGEGDATAWPSIQLESASLCVDAARQSMSMLRHYSTDNPKYIWATIHYHIAAFVSLFTSIILNPINLRAKDDLFVLVDFCRFLARLSTSSSISPSIKAVLSFCLTFKGLANAAIYQAQNASPSGSMVHDYHRLANDISAAASHQSQWRRAARSPHHDMAAIDNAVFDPLLDNTSQGPSCTLPFTGLGTIDDALQSPPTTADWHHQYGDDIVSTSTDLELVPCESQRDAMPEPYLFDFR